MAATRYLVEGERLDVLLSQVRRMGKRVTVLKAEKVRKGGLGGFFTREHYELLVEVEGVGQVPDNFRPHSAGSVIRDSSGSVMGTQADLPLNAPQAQDSATIANSNVAHSVDASDNAASSYHDPGLDALLSQAREQLNSGTEAAEADVTARLEQLSAGLGVDSHTAAAGGAGIAGSGGAQPASAQPASTMNRGFDARLQGVAAPGLPVTSPTPAPTVEKEKYWDNEDLLELGVPLDLLPEEARNGGSLSVNELSKVIPEPLRPLSDDGSVIVVVGPSPQALATVEVAGRLAGWLGDKAYTVLGGAKTALPGEGLRARSADELRSILLSRPDGVCVLALTDSLIEAHRRTMAKLLSVVYVDQTWAVVDARVDSDKLQGWIHSLPDAIKPDVLAVQRVWEAFAPAAVLRLGLPVGMLDGVPARDLAWQMLLEERIPARERD